MRSFNLSVPWVPHWEPRMRDIIDEERRKRIEQCSQWILQNSTLKPSIKMNATQARQLASDKNKKELNEQIEYIMRSIETRSKNGHYDCIYCQELKDETKHLLESEGFKITKDPQDRDGSTLYRIKW